MEIFSNNSQAPKVADGIYHIRVTHIENKKRIIDGYLVENDTCNTLSRSSSKKGLFRVVRNHFGDGTISLFSLTMNNYVRIDRSLFGFYDVGEIAKFELHKPEKPSNGAVKLRVGEKRQFLSCNIQTGGWSVERYEPLGSLFKFMPV